MDIELLREVAAEGVLKHKAGSRERGAGWQVVANKLGCTSQNMEVTSRAVRDHFKSLEKRHKSRMAEEERANKERKRRRSGETFEWLREKTEMNKKMKEEELKQRQEERKSQKEERMLFFNKSNFP